MVKTAHPRGAYQHVLFHVVLGALHIDLALGRKFLADSIERRRAGVDVLGQLEPKDSVEVPALWARQSRFTGG